MQRFFRQNLENRFFIDDKIFINQILKVLRAKIGENFIFFDGEKNIDFIYELCQIEKNKIWFEKKEEIKKTSEINLDISLFQALPNKLEKIEFIAQKATEIGVTNIYFFLAKRSQKIFLGENKLQRIKKIIVEAAEQSGRNKIPKFEILDKIDFKNLTGQSIFLHTKDDNSKKLKDLKLQNKINIFIGPEGGFDEEEVENFKKSDFEKIWLGERILRTETAGISTLFFIIQNF